MPSALKLPNRRKTSLLVFAFAVLVYLTWLATGEDYISDPDADGVEDDDDVAAMMAELDGEGSDRFS